MMTSKNGRQRRPSGATTYHPAIHAQLHPLSRTQSQYAQPAVPSERPSRRQGNIVFFDPSPETGAAQSNRPSSKTVRFNRTVSVFLIPSHRDMPAEQCEALYPKSTDKHDAQADVVKRYQELFGRTPRSITSEVISKLTDAEIAAEERGAVKETLESIIKTIATDQGAEKV